MADAILKRCCTCKEHKPVAEFGKASGTKDGLRKRCKVCNNGANAKWRADNLESSRASTMKWQAANRHKANAKQRRFVENNPGYMAKRQKAWCERNPEKARDVQERSRQKNAIHFAVANRLRRSLRTKRYGTKTFALLGYSANDLRAHLEKQFLKGMTWENFGEWHIDHIRPLASFIIADQDDPELRVAWCLTNLRPLWAIDNLRKNAKRLYLI